MEIGNVVMLFVIGGLAYGIWEVIKMLKKKVDD